MSRNHKIHREHANRLLMAMALYVAERQKRDLIRLIVAMNYRSGSSWLYLTRWINVYQQAWKIWIAALKRLADEAEADRLAELERKRREEDRKEKEVRYCIQNMRAGWKG